jgi:DNA-binding transcriptional LysR family regulator
MPVCASLPSAKTMLQLLETFCAVAEVGSLTRAAERLHTTQPAITRQMRTLERELGATLLARTPQGVALTAAGQAVLAHAREAIASVRAARQAAAGLSDGGTGRLRLAAGLMATQYVLPPALAVFRERYPSVSVELQPVHQRVALERLLGYEVEAAVLASPVRSPLVRATPVMRDPLLVVWAPGAAGDAALGGERSAEDGVRLEALRGKTVLVLAAGTGLHELVEEALRKRKVSCRLAEHPTAETIKTAVRLGMGVTILPLSAVREERHAGTLRGRAIADWPGGERAIRVLTRSSGKTNPVVSDFVAVLREVCRALEEGA